MFASCVCRTLFTPADHAFLFVLPVLHSSTYMYEANVFEFACVSPLFTLDMFDMYMYVVLVYSLKDASQSKKRRGTAMLRTCFTAVYAGYFSAKMKLLRYVTSHLQNYVIDPRRVTVFLEG